MRRVTCVLVVLALATSARAEDRKEAERYFRLGEKAYQAQDFEAAAAQFEEAYKNYALPEVAFSAAQAYRRLYRIKPQPSHVARAVELYRAYIQARPNGNRIADAADALAEMQHELDKLIAAGEKVSPELAKEHTRISINVSLGNEAQARGVQEVEERHDAAQVELHVTLDGQRVKPSSFVNVIPGEHTVAADADGYFSGSTKVVVAQGSSQIADVVLQPKPARVTINTTRGAHVTINGRATGTAPLGAVELPAGKHAVTLAMRGREPIGRELVVARGQEVTVDAPLTMTWRRRAVPYVLAGAGVAAVVTGVAGTLAYLRDRDARDTLDQIREVGKGTEMDRAHYDDLRASRDRWRTTAIIAGGALLAFGGVAGVLYYTDSGGGAAIAGRF